MLTAAETVEFSKMTFSMMADAKIKAHILQSGRKHVVLFGGETHSSVLQTCLDLLAQGFAVFIVVDATSSYNAHDRNVALARMRDSGASLTTFQSLVFELERTYEHPMAKALLAIVKD
jgi:nicotinamidase-related amidase